MESEEENKTQTVLLDQVPVIRQSLLAYYTKHTEDLVGLKMTLTVSLWSVFETEGEGESGVLLKEFCSEGIPPQTVTFLLKDTQITTLRRNQRSRWINQHYSF